MVFFIGDSLFNDLEVSQGKIRKSMNIASLKINDEKIVNAVQ